MLLSTSRSPFTLAILVLVAGSTWWGCDTTIGGGEHALVSADATAGGGSVSLSTDNAVEGEGSKYWGHLSDGEFWAHVAALDSTVNVGLKMPGRRVGVNERGQSQVPRGAWGQLTRRVERTGAVLLDSSDVHPLLTVRLTDPSQVRALRSSPFTEFVEPASFGAGEAGLFSGCSRGERSPEEGWARTSPGDIVPYSLKKLNIDDAWKRSTGEGVTIGVVDSGVSVGQPQFHDQWDDGQSAGRTIVRTWTDRNNRIGSPGPYHDTCGHGTRILGLLAAPRDGRNVVGAAYRSNVVAVRALYDPAEYFGLGSWDLIRLGIGRAAASSLIINMSFGASTGNTGVEHEIEYWHHEQGRLFFGAAGTGAPVSGVSFPATLHEVLAVTGIKPETSRAGYAACDDCFRAPLVRFSAWVNAKTTWKDDDDDAYVGGSSAATAQMSAMAALVWSRYPGWTREEVVDRLRVSAPYQAIPAGPYGTGYGPPDAWAAVGGVTKAYIAGPSRVQAGFEREVVLEAHAESLDPSTGRYTYRWSNGATSRTVRRSATCDDVGTRTLSVTITDTSDGTEYTRSKTYTVHDDAGTCSSGGGGGSGGVCEDKPYLAGCGPVLGP